MNWKKLYDKINIGDKCRFVKFVSGEIMEEQEDLKLGMVFTIRDIRKEPHNNQNDYYVKENNYIRFNEGELVKI